MNIANIKINDPILQELQHSGIKGMKWGIRKEPEVKSGAAKKIASSTLKVVGGGAIGAGTVAAGAVASSAALGALGMYKMGHDFSHSGPAVDAIAEGLYAISKIYPWLLAGGIAVGAGTAAGIVATKARNKKKKDVSHSDDDSDELMHFGIKGQKWGVRRFQNEDGTLTEEGKKRYNEQAQKLTDMATTVAELEDRTRQFDLRNARNNNTKVLVSTEDKKFYDYAYQSLLKLQKKYAKDKIHTEIKTLEDGTDYVVSRLDDKKLDGVVEYYEPLLYDSNGKKYTEKNRLFNTTKEYNKQLEHSDDELYHFNIKGAKWGIRRYQNYDGTLTEAGKLRYGVNSLSEAKPDSKATKLHAKDVQESYESQKSILQETKNITDSLSNRLGPKRGSKRVNKTDYSKMTDDELRKKINRMALERQYGDLSGDNKYVMSGKEVTRELLQTAGTIAAIGASTVGIMLGIKNLRG